MKPQTLSLTLLDPLSLPSAQLDLGSLLGLFPAVPTTARPARSHWVTEAATWLGMVTLPPAPLHLHSDSGPDSAPTPSPGQSPPSAPSSPHIPWGVTAPSRFLHLDSMDKIQVDTWSVLQVEHVTMCVSRRRGLWFSENSSRGPKGPQVSEDLGV